MNQPIVSDTLLDIVGVDSVPTIPSGFPDGEKSAPIVSFEELLYGNQTNTNLRKKAKEMTDPTLNPLLALVQLPISPLEQISSPVSAKIPTRPVREKPSFEFNFGISALAHASSTDKPVTESKSNQIPGNPLISVPPPPSQPEMSAVWQIEKTPIETRMSATSLLSEAQGKVSHPFMEATGEDRRESPIQSFLTNMLPRITEEGKASRAVTPIDSLLETKEVTGRKDISKNILREDWIQPAPSPFHGTSTISKEHSPEPLQRHVTPEAIVSQILDRADMQRLRDGQPITIELHPKELGHVRMEVVVHQQQVTLDVQVDSTQVKQAIEGAVPDIRQALADHGFSIDHCHVQTSDFAASGFFQDNRSQQQFTYTPTPKNRWNNPSLDATESPDEVRHWPNARINMLV